MVADQGKKGFEFTSIVYPFEKENAINVIVNQHSEEEYIKYINENHIEEARIVMPNLNILRQCPSLKRLYILPSYNTIGKFDFSPLYDMKEVESLMCVNEYGDDNKEWSIIDYSKINGLVELGVDAGRGAKNFNKIDSLKSLRVGGYKKADLMELFSSKELDTLDIHSCKNKTLNGIEKAQKLQCLYMYYNRSLEDISALKNVKGTLKALRIRNCPKITDFSVLAELENLEYLEIWGSNTIPDLKLINDMKNLKTFSFDVNILDGDLSPCLRLEYVYSDKNRKHYNLKDDDLPKGRYVCGNESIEEWRRLV